MSAQGPARSPHGRQPPWDRGRCRRHRHQRGDVEASQAGGGKLGSSKCGLLRRPGRSIPARGRDLRRGPRVVEPDVRDHRAAAAREISRVLKPGGRFVAAVWSGPESSDIVLFQQTAGSFAPPPPVPGVGPGAMADPDIFLAQLADAGIEADVQTEVQEFDFDDFESAWTCW